MRVRRCISPLDDTTGNPSLKCGEGGIFRGEWDLQIVVDKDKIIGYYDDKRKNLLK
jgi:hypothetical protein